MATPENLNVVPAQVGTQRKRSLRMPAEGGHWIPAFAGMTLLALSACSHAPSPRAEGGAAGWQSVRVDTPGVEGATCVLQTAAGSYVVISPASVDVPRGMGPLAVSCSKGEHYRGALTVEAHHTTGNAYAWPSGVSVPVSLYGPSLKPNYRVF